MISKLIGRYYPNQWTLPENREGHWYFIGYWPKLCHPVAKCEMENHLYKKVKSYKYKDYHIYKTKERRMGDCYDYWNLMEYKHIGYTFFNKDSAYRIRGKKLSDPLPEERLEATTHPH